jgi:aspartate racemase
MKTIGLIGGTSWESTIPYYRQINEFVKERLGGLHSAKLLLNSVDFHEVELLMRAEDWSAVGHHLANAARALELAGADCIALCSNTLHKVAPAIESQVRIPLLHIADPTAEVIKAAGHTIVGLLGTRFTMEEDFLRDRLASRHGLTVLTPSSEDRETVHRVVFEELCLGKILPESRNAYRRIIGALAAQGAQAIILGCTEISMLITQHHTQVPLFDTTAIHALHLAAWSLGKDPTAT